ncbi:MAG: helix-turn-helix transcriptional regulator [Clostridiales bacterium]|nr:helix-turn-helix transcriptional regulator [Clostridiales bacterium]
MNIEIANRLVQLRKQNNLSQEALAEKLGISRQAVSKWERAEASPDTDNLILLARLYGVSLDDLLQTEDEIPRPEEEIQEEKEDTPEGSKKEEEEYVHIGLKGIHVKDKDGSEVHVGWDGIHVEDKKDKNSVHIEDGHIYVNGEEKEYTVKEKLLRSIPYPIFTIIAYLIMGIGWNMWNTGWIVFVTIPIWYSLVSAIVHRNANHFAYPVLMVVIYLILGIFEKMWHPGWVVFLTIPVYYWLVNDVFKIITSGKKKQNKDMDKVTEYDKIN